MEDGKEQKKPETSMMVLAVTDASRKQLAKAEKEELKRLRMPRWLGNSIMCLPWLLTLPLRPVGHSLIGRKLASGVEVFYLYQF
jgi:hypothetical protein